MDIRDYMERRKIDKGKRWRVVKFYSITPRGSRRVGPVSHPFKATFHPR